MRTYFVLHFDSQEAFCMLRDAEAGRLVKALFRYNTSGELPENLKGGAAILFSQLRSQHDRDRERYEKKCAANRENAQKRWEKAEQEAGEAPEDPEPPQEECRPEPQRPLTLEQRRLLAVRDAARDRLGIRV